MNSEPFWDLIPNIGCEVWVKSKGSMRSFSNLQTAINFAQIDLELKELLLKVEDSEVLIKILLDKYFPTTKNNYDSGGNYNFEI